jgi:hypothetical protein
LQEVPSLTLEYIDVLRLGWQVSQVFAPFVAPAATHAPAMSQKPALRIAAEHRPVELLHVPAMWHESGAVQVTWLPAVHVPDWHVSLRSQALPSLQAVPLVTFEYCELLTLGWHASHVFVPFAAPAATQAPPIEQNPALRVAAEHTPVEGLQVPAVWQESGAVQATWLSAVQAPDWQVSVRSHALPSLHDVPLLTLEYAVVLKAGWHVSHVFVPFAAPEATHTPPISHPPEHVLPSDPNPS